MRKGTILAVIIFLAAFAMAQTPNWAVNANDYQFNMTVTGEGLIDCQAVIAADDRVAAFVGDTCRGVIDFNTEVNGKRIAYLIIYSNISQGEQVSFKLYDESENTVMDLVNTAVFEENASMGNTDSPVLLSNNNPPTALNLNNLMVTDVSLAGDVIADFTTVDIDNDVYSYSLINSMDNDNSNFEITANELVLFNSIDFSVQSTYEIEVEASDGNGCSISDTFTISIQNTNEPPTDITFLNEDNSVNENEEEGTVVGTFEVEDPTTEDTHTYSLEADELDNSLFSIQEDNLLTAEVFNYEEQDSYTISVRVTDASGNFYIKELMVKIEDVVELEDLKANNVITPNGDGFNDSFTVPNVALFDTYEFQVFNENGNLVFRRSPSAGYNNLWDGKTTKGNDLPSGVYYYILEDFESENQFTGVVNLLRE